jgi:hypothetical protein
MGPGIFETGPKAFELDGPGAAPRRGRGAE